MLPRDLIRAFFRHKRKAVLTFLAVVGGVALFTLLTPRTYRSQAKLFVRLGRENATLDPTATIGQAPVVAVPQSRENEINTAVEILKSRVLLEKVVDAVGPSAILNRSSGAADSETERYLAIKRLASMLDVDPVKKSNVLMVSYDGPTPELAQTVVSKLLDFYLERHIQLSRTPGAHQFLAEQTARQRAELTRAEEQLRDLRNETGLVASDTQKQIVLGRIGRLQDDLLQTEGTLSGAEAEARLLRERVAKLAPTHITSRVTGIRNEAADNMRGQLYALQLRELELRLKYPEGHPDLERVRQQVTAAKSILAHEEQRREQITEGPNRVQEEAQLALVKLEPVLASLRGKADTLRAEVAREQAQLRTFNENSLRLARLERAVALQEANFKRYAENLEQAQIDRALEAGRLSNISIIEPATYDINPVSPRLALNYALGVLAALVGGLGLALMAERLNPSVKSMEDVENHVGLPVLASLPRLNGEYPLVVGTREGKP